MKKEIKKTNFKVGQRVLVRNLKVNEGIIGKKGTVTEIDNDDLPVGVKFDGDHQDEECYWFKDKEIELITEKSKNKKPVVKLVGTEYRIEKGQYHLHVRVTNGRLTLTHTNGRNKDYRFIGSKPETVKAIGELLIKASEL